MSSPRDCAVRSPSSTMRNHADCTSTRVRLCRPPVNGHAVVRCSKLCSGLTQESRSSTLQQSAIRLASLMLKAPDTYDSWDILSPSRQVQDGSPS
eukprot:5504534-Amphidinium_carterae.1